MSSISRAFLYENNGKAKIMFCINLAFLICGLVVSGASIRPRPRIRIERPEGIRDSDNNGLAADIQPDRLFFFIFLLFDFLRKEPVDLVIKSALSAFCTPASSILLSAKSSFDLKTNGHRNCQDKPPADGRRNAHITRAIFHVLC